MFSPTQVKSIYRITCVSLNLKINSPTYLYVIINSLTAPSDINPNRNQMIDSPCSKTVQCYRFKSVIRHDAGLSDKYCTEYIHETNLNPTNPLISIENTGALMCNLD